MSKTYENLNQKIELSADEVIDKYLFKGIKDNLRQIKNVGYIK